MHGKAEMRRSAGRRRRGRVGRRCLAGALALVLLALGIYFVGAYRERMEYARYPLKHRELIVDTAGQFGLEPWHVAAVVCCESGFRADAVSGAGARGLMQIMPETGLWLAGKFDEAEGYTDEALFEPETNLKYGCWFLNWLMRRYDGDRTLATAAYHAGQGKVDQWLADPSVSADGKRLDVIPYASTQTYVERVLKACEKYQELYDFTEEPKAG